MPGLVNKLHLPVWIPEWLVMLMLAGCSTFLAVYIYKQFNAAYYSKIGKDVAKDAVFRDVKKYYLCNKKRINNASDAIVKSDKEESYNAAKEALDAIVTDMGAEGINGARILVTFPDGTVAYDSSKNDDGLNTFSHKEDANISGPINENHMTRFAFQSAAGSIDGRGAEIKLSTSTGNNESYYASRTGPFGATESMVRLSGTDEPIS